MPRVPGQDTRLVLIRHEESRASVAGVVGGHRACQGLPDRGRAQAEALPERLQAPREFEADGSEKATFAMSGERRGLAPDVQAALLRIGQESLNNIRRHAEASRVEVTLAFHADAVTLRVQDDGKGFDSGKIMGSGHMGLGLFGMQERLALVAGWLHIESSIGAGTTVIARVPLSAAS